MSTTQSSIIQLNFDSDQLESMLVDEGKTHESFQIDVLDHLQTFMLAQHGKIHSCVVSITPYIHTTMMMEAVRYDDELQDACTVEELELAQQKGWSNVNIVLIPHVDQATMEAFHETIAHNAD